MSLKLPYHNIKGCVFKLYWGEKFVIIKCKTYARAKTIIEQSIVYHFKTGMNDKLYNNFFDYIDSNSDHQFVVEIIYQNDNPYQLLVAEQQELNKSKADPNCMNVNTEAYIPKRIQGNRKAWINRGHYLNFKNWRKQNNG